VPLIRSDNFPYVDPKVVSSSFLLILSSKFPLARPASKLCCFYTKFFPTFSYLKASYQNPSADVQLCYQPRAKLTNPSLSDIFL
jgi:hypothetical protein